METPKLPLEEIKRLNKEARKQTLSYITAAFGLVAGLAWNEAIQAGIAYWIPLGRNSITAKFFYAAIITVVLVLVTNYLARILIEPADK